MARLRWVPILGIGCALLLSAGVLPLLAQTPPPIKFEVPPVKLVVPMDAETKA